MHKHFHMLSISSFLRSHGHALLPPSSQSESQELLVPHTRIPGIWAKLDVLYDLSTLDEREDQHALARARAGSEESDAGAGEDESPDPAEGEWVREFALPEYGGAIPVMGGTSTDGDGEEEDEGFSELMWQKRFRGDDEEGGSSPIEMPMYRGRDGVVGRASLSPAPTAASSTTKRVGRGGRRGGAVAATTTTRARRDTIGSRRSSRFDSEMKSSPPQVAPEQEEAVQDTEEDEEGEDEEEDGDEESQDEAEEAKPAKSTRGRPSMGGRRGRSSTTGTGRSRGRGRGRGRGARGG